VPGRMSLTSAVPLEVPSDFQSSRQRRHQRRHGAGPHCRRGRIHRWRVHDGHEQPVYFAGNDGLFGSELWRTDGTGTGRVRDIRPGSPASGINNLTTVGGQVFFTANDGATGYELWRSDGTSSGTWLVRNIWLGSSGSAPGFITAVGDRIFFTGYRGDVSNEFYSFREDIVAPTVASISSTSSNGTDATGQTVDVTLTFSEPVTLTGTLSLTLDTGAELSVASFAGTTASSTDAVQAGQTSSDLNATQLAARAH
jgi:ELWxxDGT repeat protein